MIQQPLNHRGQNLYTPTFKPSHHRVQNLYYPTFKPQHHRVQNLYNPTFEPLHHRVGNFDNPSGLIVDHGDVSATLVGSHFRTLSDHSANI